MLLRWLISTIGFAALKGEVSARAGRAGRRGALYVLVGLLWLTALGFLLGALTVWLAGLWGAVVACAVVGAGLILIGLAIQLGLVITGRRKQPGVSLPFADLGAPAAAGAAGAAAPGGFLGSLALIAIVGWLLGRQMNRK